MSGKQHRTTGTHVALVALFGIAYFLSAQLGSALSLGSSAFCTFWPPSGIFVAALLLAPTRLWPALVLAVFPANIAFDLLHDRAIPTSLCFCFALSLEALTGAFLFRRLVCERPDTGRLRDILGLALLSALLSPALSALIGAAVVCNGRGPAAYWYEWRLWWASDVLGVVLFAPVLLAWWPSQGQAPRLRITSRHVEGACVAAVCALIGSHQDTRHAGEILLHGYMVLPAVLWAAIRLGAGGVVPASVLFSVTTVWAGNRLPSAVAVDQAALQLCLAMVSLTGLVAAAALSERQRAAEALTRQTEELGEANRRADESLALFRTLLSHAPAGLAFVGTDLRYIHVNEVLAAINGAPAAEHVGRTPAEVIPDLWPQFEPLVTRVLETGTPATNVEMSLSTHGDDSRVRRWLVSCHPVALEDGRLLGAGVLVVDVTAHWAAEEALRESEARYRIVAETVLDVIWVLDIETLRLRYVSPSVERLRGYPAEAVMAQPVTDILTPASVQHLQQVIAQRLPSYETGEIDTYTDQYEMQHRDGSTIWAEITCRVRMNEESGHLEVFGVTRDVTARRAAEERLRQSEAALRRAQQVAHMGNWTWHVASGRLEWSEEMLRILGIDPEGLTGDISEVIKARIHPDDQAAVQASLASILAGAKPGSQEYRVVWPDGQVRVVWGEAGELTRDETGAPLTLTGISQDVTERRKAEEERRELQEQLLQAQKMEAIGLLAGGVAHDLNNMLTPILGYGDLLLAKLAPGDPNRFAVSEMLQAGNRARDVVRQLLALGRKQVLEMQSVDLTAVVARFERLLRHTIREDIEIVFSLCRALPPVRVDVGQIEQVLLNLAVNAQDAMPDGGTLTIETQFVRLDEGTARPHADSVPGPYVMLAVSDTGHGMDSETLDRIFTPFFTTKEKGRGSGLGLATAFGIVKQHGGSIWVYSEPGHGTTFKVYIPCEVDAEAADHAGAAPAAPAAAGGTETILVVEDDPAVRGLAVSLLGSLGYTVLAAANGTEALELAEARNAPVDLLLTDVVLPGMSSRMLAAEMNQRFPQAGVLFMSGYTDNVIAHRGVLDEGIHFIQKPFTVDGLASKIREVLSRQDPPLDKVPAQQV